MVQLKVKTVSLRDKAEMFIQNNIRLNETLTEDKALKLLHELELYQIELEMQKEEILAEKEKADALSKKYANLYDLAPSGYITLNRNGVLLEINMTGANMLNTC